MYSVPWRHKKLIIINIFLYSQKFTKILGHMKVHTFQKNPKRSGHIKAHSIILEFVPLGMCETNIYRDNLIRT
jgi:hypothetical protein